MANGGRLEGFVVFVVWQPTKRAVLVANELVDVNALTAVSCKIAKRLNVNLMVNRSNAVKHY